MNRSKGIINVLRETGFSLLDEGITLRVRALGFSMYPTVKPGSIILLEPYPPMQQPEKGEIIAWKRDSGFVVHRLTGITEKENEKFFITRGDSSESEDLPVSEKQLAGRVIAIENPAGTIIRPATYIPSRFIYLRNRILAWLALRRSMMQRIFQKRVV